MKKNDNNLKFHKIKKILISISLSIIFICVYTISFTLSLSKWKNYDPNNLYNFNLTTSLYDKNNNEYLCVDGGENRVLVDADNLPDHVKNAFISIEDARFYEHNGIDLIRIFGAIINDIKTASLKEGASTITQQLVKTSELTNEKKFSRKISEIIMSLKTEQKLSKSEILSLYLNSIYFGNGAYGIEAASLKYFNKNSNELSISEAATLVGIIKSPSEYSPHINLNKCIARRNIVLEAMYKNNHITKDELSVSISEPINIVKNTDNYDYGYYSDTVLNEATNILGISMSELINGGYKIYTSLDTESQSFIEDLAKNDNNFPTIPSDGEKPETAIVLIEAETGEICALIGGRSHSARLSFSRATDMKRQPGSSIKPVLVFGPAVEFNNYTTTSFLLDQPLKYNDYTPRNSGGSFKGWITLRDISAFSVNIPAVYMLDEIGVSNAINHCENIGIEFSQTDNNLSLALGGFTHGITPLQLAAAYQPFANGGYYHIPTTIRYILNNKGDVIYSSNNHKYSIISPETSYLITSMLLSSVDYGTSMNLKCNIPLAAKTGTTKYDDASNNKDAWIVAYNSEFILSVWTGFDKTDSVHSLIKGETGGTFPAKISKAIFEKLYQNKEIPEFTIPDGIISIDIDYNALHNNFSVVPVISNNECVTEYYTKDSLPSSIYSSNDPIDFVYKDLD